MSRGAVIAIIIAGCVLLVIANISLWMTLDVFNADRFGQHVAEGMQSEAATEALAVPIVDWLLTEVPELPRFVQGPVEEAVAWLLQRPILTPVFEETAAIATTVMTTSAEDVVGIDIGGALNDLGTTAVGLISTLDPEAGANAEAMLEGIMVESGADDVLMVYESGFFPALRTLSIVVPWIALLAGLGALGLFLVAMRRAADILQARKYAGIGILITSFLGYVILVPALQLIVQNGVAAPVMQVVVREVVSVLTRPYFLQSTILFVIGLTIWIVNREHGEPQVASDVGIEA